MWPTECIEDVLVFVPVKDRFRIATDLRLLYTQKTCLGGLEFASAAHASRKGQCDLLDAHASIKTHGQENSFIMARYTILKAAAQHGQVAVLQWCLAYLKSKDMELEQDVETDIIEAACTFGQVAVLDWWKENGNQATWPHPAYYRFIICAAWSGHTLILQWWQHRFQCILTRVCRHESLIEASARGHVAVLQWWSTSGWVCCDQSSCCDHPGGICKTDNGKFHVKKSGRKAALEAASANGHVSVLRWWQHCGKALVFSERAVLSASACGQIDVLEWWKENFKKKFMYYDYRYAVSLARQNGHMAVVNWWSNP